jgi:WD40 repeat protein
VRLRLLCGNRHWGRRDIDSPKLIATIHSPTPGLENVTFSPSGADIEASGANGTVEVWDVGMPSAPARVVRAPYGLVATISMFVSDDQLINVSNGLPGAQANARDMFISSSEVTLDTVQWLDVPRDALTLGSIAGGYAPAYAPDGRTLTTVGAAASGDSAINLWDVGRARLPQPVGVLDTGTGIETPSHQLQPPTVLGNSASFSRQGHLMATSSSLSVRLWDVTNIRDPRPLATISAPNGLQPTG